MTEVRRRDAGRRLARAAIAGTLGALAIWAAEGERAGAEDASALLPEGLHLPRASAPLSLAGNVDWNGGPSEKFLFRSEEDPKAIVAHFRAQWEARPVEWVEAEIPGGRALTVYDFHEGRRWVLAARRRGEGPTEVIRSMGPLAHGARSETPLPIELPEGVELVSRMRDAAGGARVTTALAVEGRRAASTPAAICRAAAVRGWAGACALAGDGETLEAIELERGEARLSLAFGEGPLGMRWLSLRWEEE